MLKVILAFLGLMMLTSKVHAVTALVPVIAGFFGGGAIASLIVGLALSYIVGKIFAPEKEEREEPADQGVKQRIPTDPRNKLPIVYGTKSVAGQITYASISGNNQKMAFIIALAEGPVTSINTVKWDDKTLSFSGNINTGLRSVSNASPDAGGSDDFLNSGRFRVRVFPAGGRCTEMEGFDSDWKAGLSDAQLEIQRSMPNTAYAYCELTYDQEKRVTSLSNRLQFTITGKTVRPLTSSTTAANYETPAEATSNNPAEILVDYLTNTRYGAGVPLNAIDFSTFFSHAQFCDEDADYTPVGGGTPLQETRYTTNGSINTNQDVDQNVTDLTIGNSAMLTWNYGQFGIVSDRVKNNVDLRPGKADFDEENIFGKIQISKLGFDNKLNEITAKFDSLKSKEQEEQIILDVDAEFRNDNEPVLERTVTLPMTNNAIEARRVSAIYLNKSRQDLMVNFTTSLEASGVESGDVIEVAHETTGWPTAADITAGRRGKQFIVQSVEEKVANNIISLEITAQEYSADAYDDTINDEDGAPNTRLPNPFAAPIIENLTAVEDTTIDEANLISDWNDEASSPLIGQYEINYSATVNTTEATTIVPADTTLTVSSTIGFPESGSLTIGTAGSTLLSGGLTAGDTSSISVDSTDNFTDSGTITLINGTFDYTSKTSTTFDNTTAQTVLENDDDSAVTQEAQVVAYASKTASVFNLSSAISTIYAIGTSSTLTTKTFRTVSGGTRYEISPLTPQTSYVIEVTPISTLGNRGVALFVTGTTGVARIIGEAGADGVAGVNGTSGLDGTFERAVYFNNNNTPATPDDNNAFNTVNNTVNAPTGNNGTEQWENNPTASDTDQRWVSRTIINTNGETQEQSQIAFDAAATSGIQTLISNGERESGYFDVTGNPGTAVSEVFEETIITTNGIAGAIVDHPAVAEINSMSLAVSTTTGTNSVFQPAGQESTAITITGVANLTEPRSNNDTTDRTVQQAEDQSTPSNFTCRYGQQYDNASLVYSGNVGSDGAIARSTDGGLSFTVAHTSSGTTSRFLDVTSGTASGTHYFVACGRDGWISYSTNNGSSWTDFEIVNTTNDFLSIDFANGIFCVCGQNGRIYTTNDPTQNGTSSNGWTSRGGAGTNNMNFVKAGKNNSGTDIFVAVGQNGTIATDSATGTGSFSTPASGTTQEIHNVDYNEDDQQWAAARGDGFSSAGVCFSTDGESSWSSQQFSNFFGSGVPTYAACGNGFIVVVAQSGFRGSIAYSNDGGSSTFDTFETGTFQGHSYVHFVAGFFLCSGFSGASWFTDPSTDIIPFSGGHPATPSSHHTGSWGTISGSPGNGNFDNVTYIDDRIDNTDGAGGALVGSCWYLDDAPLGDDFRYRVSTNAECNAFGNSLEHNFVRCNRISAEGTLFGVRETIFELDVDNAENGGNIFGSFLNQSNSTQMAEQMAEQINRSVADGNNTNLSASVAGSVVTVLQDNGGNFDDIDTVPTENFVNETDPNSSYEGANETDFTGTANNSIAITPGSIEILNRRTTYTINAPSGHTNTSQSYTFGNNLTQAQALTELQGRFGSGNDFDNYTISGSSSPFTITSGTAGVETPNMTLTINDQGTDDNNNNLTVTGSNIVSAENEGVDFFQTGGATTFSVSVNGVAEATDVSFSESANAETQAQEIESAIGLISGHTVDYTANSNVITITATSDGNKTDATVSYTFLADDDHTATTPVPSITDGVTGLTPDGMFLNFKGSDNPAIHSFTFGSNQTLDQVLTRILLEGNNFIDEITFYDGNAAASTTTTKEITAGDHAFVDVTSTEGFPETGSVTIGSTTFAYTSLTSGSDLFGDCTLDPLTDRTSCEAASGTFTPFIRLNGSDTTFPLTAIGTTVTGTTVRYPGVDSTNNRRVAWEYDAIRSNGEINELTVTGTATDGDVEIVIDGITVTATVATANDIDTNTSVIRTEINNVLFAASSDVTTVTGDVDNRIRIIGNNDAGNYVVSINDTSGLSIANSTVQDFVNPTVSTGISEVGGNAGGNFDVINGSFSIENTGSDEVIIGELTTADVAIDGVTYTISYRGREDDGLQFTPFEAATSQEQADQLVDFLNAQP